MTDSPNPPYNTLTCHTRCSYTVVEGVTVPLQHINTHIYGLHAPVLTTVFLLFADDVCLVAPQPQLLHDVWQHIRVLHHAGMLRLFHGVTD